MRSSNFRRTVITLCAALLQATAADSPPPAKASQTEASAPDSAMSALVQPTTSPLTKIQLVAKSGDSTLYLQPQISGFIVRGGFVVTVAHPFDEALIRRLGSAKLAAHAKFPLFEKSFFRIKTEAYPEDIFYVDESESIFKNHTYFLKLTSRMVDYEHDFSIWSFNPELAGKLPALELARQSSYPVGESCYLLQSADPANSTGYLINEVRLDGFMYQHVPMANPLT